MADNQKNDKEIDDVKDEEKKEEEKVPDLGGTKRLGQEFGKPYGCLVIGGHLSSFGNGCMMPLFGVLFREIFEILEDSIVGCELDENGEVISCDTNFAENSLRTLGYWIGMGTGAGVFSILQYYFWGSYGTHVAIDARAQWFKVLLRQDISFHDDKTSSVLNALLTTESAAIENGIGIKYGFFLQQIYTFLVGVALAFIYSWRLTLVLLATMPLLMIIGAIEAAMWSGSGRDSDPFVGAGALSQEILTNIRTVISIPDLVVRKYEDFKNKVAEGYPIATKRAFIVGGSMGVYMLIMIGVMYAIGIFAGARFVADGYISVGDMFGAFFCFVIGGMGLGQLASALPDMQKAGLASNKFFADRDRKPQMAGPESKDKLLKPSTKLTGALEFRNVCFAYKSNPDHIVLNKVSFTVSAGETVALVGPSGSGKSTCVSLLERFYDPTEGEIVLEDGNNIQDYDVSYLRSQIGLVSQMPLLFDASITENIRGGNVDATEEQVQQAAKLANAHAFVLKLPQGYNTSVGELGGRLSGGQRQRIAIARAMLNQPSILLLDEATSALDSKSEKEVQDAIDQIAASRNQTVLAIAHRLSTVKNYDKIVVLVDGSIREVGNHRELMDKNGVYAALVSAQALVEEKINVHERRRSSLNPEAIAQLQEETQATTASSE